MQRIYNPNEDGISHINVYSKGKTELGRLLTNFAETPFKHPELGYFRTMESYWYYLKTGKVFENIRDMDGYTAKKFGRKVLPKTNNNEKREISDDFKEKIREGIRCKLKQNKKILKMLVQNDLPLSHYYVYGNTVKPLPEFDWILEEIERIKEITIEYLKNKNN